MTDLHHSASGPAAGSPHTDAGLGWPGRSPQRHPLPTDVGAVDLATSLRDLVLETLEQLESRHLREWRVPGTFGGHPVGADVVADLAFTLGLLDAGGVARVAGEAVDDVLRTVLGQVDGAGTHTFFSYRVAETLARRGPFAGNPLLAGLDDHTRDEIAAACDTSSWIPLLDEGLPRNYAAVLARAETARAALDLPVEPAVVAALVARTRALLEANPAGFLDDSTHGIGRYDIYAADVWLFTEPIAPQLGAMWADGVAAALRLVDATGTEDGVAVPWGRSTGVLAAALTVELGALAAAGSVSADPSRWLRRTADAVAGLSGWFDDGLVNAHQHRSPYAYRGPFRRLQLTLDVLGKLAWAAAHLGAGPAARPVDGPGEGPLVGGAHPTPGIAATHRAGPTAAAYPWIDELVRFEADGTAAVWVHRRPGLSFSLPVVGATRSDYVPAPHRPGRFDTPVDAAIACWAPLIIAGGRSWTTGGRPVEIVHEPGSLRVRWDHLVPAGELDPAADRDGDQARSRDHQDGRGGPDRLDEGRPPGLDRPGEDQPRRAELGGSAVVDWTVQGRALHLDLTLELDAAPDAVTVVVPESGDRALVIDQVDNHGGPTAHRDRIDVRGIAEWRSFWTELPVVHQLDLDRGPRQHLSFRVTPELRVASTAHSHHYDRSLYEPLAGRARSVTPPIGPLAGVVGAADPTLRGIDLFHLHWPEWFAFDDLDAHRHAIALLADRRVPVVWTAHNLTPHDKDAAAYDPVYQLWADAADVVIHHSDWGAQRMQARYRFGSGTEHVVIPHGHFGELWAGAVARPQARARAEVALGLTPCRWRIGLVGAPRHEKQVSAFLEGVARCHRDDLQVVCWSLDDRDVVPVSPRIAIAERYEMVDERTYGRRLAVCDLLALPFDPAGEMLATGTAADVVGLGLGALVSDWPYLAEALGAAGIPCGSDPDGVAAALDRLTDDDVLAAQAASRSMQAELAWPAIAERTFAVLDRLTATGGRHA